MNIETYEVTEATTEGRDSFEIEAEAHALIEELGLDGQKQLVAPSEDGVETGTRIPYRKMTLEEKRVYQTLYPESSSVESYSAGPIPLRVLQVVAHSRTLFDSLEVWGPATQDPDPVLVGKMNRTDMFLLARWGDALAPYEDLLVKAREMVRERFTKNAKRVIHECEALIAAPDTEVDKFFESNWYNAHWE